MNKFNLSEEEVILHFGSDEGCTIYSYKKNRYLIFYNDLNIYYKTPTRRTWTLAHELGHVILNHLTMTNKVKIFRNSLNDDEYQWMETEANRFASLLLANPIILHKLNIKSNIDIMKICKISEEASNYRFSDYLKWCKNKYVNKNDLIIIRQFYDFIYKKHCMECYHTFVSEDTKYCPICGNNLLQRGDGEMIYNDGFELDDNSKALICPRCRNEQMFDDGVYCRICNTYLINKCSNESGYEIEYDEWVEPCGRIASGNSRFCEYCGSKTTFYNQGLLKDWQEVKVQIEEEQAKQEVASTIYLHDKDIPF